MKATPPEVGKIYISRTDPTVRVYVESVHPYEADEEEDLEAGFGVDVCDPVDKNNMGAIGTEYEFDDWVEADFIPESEHPAESCERDPASS